MRLNEWRMSASGGQVVALTALRPRAKSQGLSAPATLGPRMRLNWIRFLAN